MDQFTPELDSYKLVLSKAFMGAIKVLDHNVDGEFRYEPQYAKNYQLCTGSTFAHSLQLEGAVTNQTTYLFFSSQEYLGRS